MSDILIDTAQLASISGSWNGSAFAYTATHTGSVAIEMDIRRIVISTTFQSGF